jgi:flagellar biosynthesis/type III secretory pathway protein FliH
VSLHFGRIQKAQGPGEEASDEAHANHVGITRAHVDPLAGGPRLGRIMRATRVAEAEAEAARILQEARTFADTQRESLLAEARARAERELATAWFKQHAMEASFENRSKDDVIRCATILAERVIGEELHLAPVRMVAIAEQVLRETRGAKQALVTVHPEDAPVLRQLLADSPVYQIETSTELTRGGLLIKTDLGLVNGNIRLQLERLAEIIRRSM